jgi:hypothetical protein
MLQQRVLRVLRILMFQQSLSSTTHELEHIAVAASIKVATIRLKVLPAAAPPLLPMAQRTGRVKRHYQA